MNAKTRSVRALVVLAAVVSLTGCSQFHEQYLFRSGRPGRANYYRVTISGHTTFSSSQFAAGLYDAEAVDALFGELKGPGKLVSVQGTALAPQTPPGTGTPELVDSSDPDVKTNPVQTLDGKPVNDQKFVFFLSSNANAFINAIQTYVDSERMQTAMVSLLVKDDVREMETARAEERVETRRANSLSKAIDATVQPLGTGDAAQSKSVREVTLRLLALLASRSDTASPRSFASIEDAEQWLRESPRAFRAREDGL
jgi:hypothetical protein